MVWALVFGLLAIATLVVLAIPAMQILTAVKALSKQVTRSQEKLQPALDEINDLLAESELGHTVS